MNNSRFQTTMGHRIFFIAIIGFFILQIGVVSALADTLVKKAQESLIEQGLNPGPVDGLWGPKTEGALKQFQEKNGISVSGKLDEETKNLLFSVKKEELSVEATPSEPPPMEEAPKNTEIATDNQAVSEPEPIEQKTEAPMKEETEKTEAVTESKAVPPPESPKPKAEVKSPPEPKKEMVNKVVKASGPCPQKRKTKNAPSNIASMDKTGNANLDNGKKIYNKSAKPMACKMCHGDEGNGKGKLGAALKPQPRNFTCAETMENVSPGQMFWIIKNGSPGTGMVAHKKTLKDQDIWDVVKYIRSTYMGSSASEDKAAAKPTPKSENKMAVATEPPPAMAAAKPAMPSNAVTKLPKNVKPNKNYSEEAVNNGGSISGMIQLIGDPPAPILEDLSKGKNSEFCSTHPDAKGNTRLRTKVVATNGKLKDAVVFIQNIEKGKAWSKDTNNFDFKTCDIFPKISVVRKPLKGVKEGLLTVTNQDLNVLHNPHGYSVVGANRKTLFNKPLPSQGDVTDVTKSFKRFKPKKDKHFFLQCDQHNFMEADARVVWNPYYSISAADGTFKIDQIPAGTYWLTAWHPYVGEMSQEVTVTAGVNLDANFDLTAK